MATGKSVHSIAVALNRAPSTISREVRRNQGRQRYRAARADQTVQDRARRSKLSKLALQRVFSYTSGRKAPPTRITRAVAGWFGRSYPDDTSRQVSPVSYWDQGEMFVRIACRALGLLLCFSPSEECGPRWPAALPGAPVRR